MTGIPVYTQSPITAAKAEGITPKTASAPAQTPLSAPATNPATATATASTSSPYPKAQPGQQPVPAPTNALGHPTGPAQNYTPSPATPTKTKSDEGPPAPQPGAVPLPPGGITSNMPPPPKVGEKYVTPVVQKAPSPPFPIQIGYSSPNVTYQQPTSSTVSASTPSQSYPVPLPTTQSLGLSGESITRSSLEHPPGYQQNPYASNETAAQRAASQHEVDRSNQWHRAGDPIDGTDEGNLWQTAKTWVYSAGEKLAEAEAQVWKRINGEK